MHQDSALYAACWSGVVTVASENSSGTFLFPFFIIAFSDIDAFGRREDVINSVVGGYWEYFTSVADMF